MTERRWVLIVGIMLSVFAVAFQAIGIATALPTVMEHFGASHLYPWAFTTFISGMLLAVIVAGRVADVHGPSLPIYVGFALFTVGVLVAWLAPSVWVLLGARLIQGLGAGALNLTLTVIVAHGFPAEHRPKIMALVSFCWLLPAFVGPPIAAWLTLFDWRLVFAVMVPLSLIAFVITVPGVRGVQAQFDGGDGDVPPIPVAATAAVVLAPSFILLAGQPIGMWRWISAAAGSRRSPGACVGSSRPRRGASGRASPASCWPARCRRGRSSLRRPSCW
ncbi:MAG: MFS transporter [Propionibacteriaceae bacterium]|nr:MFS transporter [Propionibacteriaceae bacterium]